LGQALDVIRQHHEKLDGSGYPDGLKKDDISIASRIMAVVDIYDALITNRAYREGLSFESAFEILRKEVKKEKLDELVVEKLIETMSAKHNISHNDT
jgi:HD-GYP domain-containing protein (c-di-GMP phosphodiesterase class II)